MVGIVDGKVIKPKSPALRRKRAKVDDGVF